VLDFGIYAGWSVGEIAARDPGYLEWVRDRREARRLGAEIDLVLKRRTAVDEESGHGPKRGKRRR
jgi:hypothetical protein